MNTVYLVCLGASADIKDNSGMTPLQMARNEKVYMKTHTHTITNFDIANGC